MISHVHACDDQSFDAAPDAVLVLALPTNESETSQSQRRARKGRFACFSIRNDRAPYLPSKNALRLQKQRQTCEMIPFARTTVSTWVAPARCRLRSRKSNARHGHFGRVFFFFFACVHHVGLAYISSDLRTCTQRMFARNISDDISPMCTN